MNSIPISKTSASLRLCGENQLEVVAGNQAESAAILVKCEERITDYTSHLHKSEGISNGWRFLIGMQCVIARPHVPLAARGEHGDSSDGSGFQKWVEARWGYDHRTVNNWMRFAEVFLAVAPRGLSQKGTVSVLQDLPVKLLNGGLNEKEREGVFDLIPQVLGDDGMMDFIDKHAPRKKGGLLPITFHCTETISGPRGSTALPVVCGQKLKQIAGRNIKCPKCGATVKARADVKDATAEERTAANERLNELAAKLDGVFNEASGDKPNQSDRAKCSDETWRNLVRACQQISTFDRNHKGTKNTKGRPSGKL